LVAARLVLSFIDTGIGMSPEVQQQIFKPFFSLRSGAAAWIAYAQKKLSKPTAARLRCRANRARERSYFISLTTSLAK